MSQNFSRLPSPHLLGRSDGIVRILELVRLFLVLFFVVKIHSTRWALLFLFLFRLDVQTFLHVAFLE